MYKTHNWKFGARRVHLRKLSHTKSQTNRVILIATLLATKPVMSIPRSNNRRQPLDF